MTKKRIITGIEVTSGETSDGKQWETLVEKSKKNGIEVISGLVTPKNDGLEYNKNAGTMQGPAEELAMRADKKEQKGSCIRF